MKILAVIGSPHGMNGNTGALLASVVRGAEERGAEVKMISLASLKVQPCRGCEACHMMGKCVIKDDFESIRAAMLEADGLILASPNYISGVTAQMKAFFDRCGCPIHCQALEGRHGAAVVTSGGSGAEDVVTYMWRFLRTLGCWTVGGVGIEAWRLGQDSERGDILFAAANLGRALVEAIANKTEYTDQLAEKQAFVERMKSLITVMKDAWPYEHDHWQSCGKLGY